MKWMKRVWINVWRDAWVFFVGSCRASSSTGTIAMWRRWRETHLERVRRRKRSGLPWISGFLMTDPICFKACVPLFCTRWCESVNTSISLGTILGKQVDNCFGAQCAIAPREEWNVDQLTCHWCYPAIPLLRISFAIDRIPILSGVLVEQSSHHDWSVCSWLLVHNLRLLHALWHRYRRSTAVNAEGCWQCKLRTVDRASLLTFPNRTGHLHVVERWTYLGWLRLTRLKRCTVSQQGYLDLWWTQRDRRQRLKFSETDRWGTREIVRLTFFLGVVLRLK